jgi:hypothetical protein
MPWHVVSHHADCPAGKPYAVVKDADGSVEGCHATRGEADDHMRALYANDSNGGIDMTGAVTIEAGGKPNPGTKPDKRLKANKATAQQCPPGMKPDPDKDGSCMPMTAAEIEVLAAAEAAMTPTWRGVMVVEGVPTGDRREFALDSLNWPDPAEVTMALQWQKESSHGGDHDVTVAVGRIDRIWREAATIERDGNQVDANLIWGEGRYDTHTDAVEAQRRMNEEMLNGCSVGADDISDMDVEYVWPTDEAESEDSDEGEEPDILSLLFGRPEKVIFHSARLRAVTLCDIPAYVEATLHAVGDGEPTGEALVAAAAATVIERARAAVAPHETEISLAEWDGAANEARMRISIPRIEAAGAYAYVEPGAGDVARTGCRFLHHEIDGEGHPGPANLSACLSLIQAVHAATLPEPEKAGIYRHLAAHLNDAGMDIAPYEPHAALLAHAWQETDLARPAAWFADPEIKAPMPIIVAGANAQGFRRVYGLACEWHECHIGFSGECVLPPREVYHDRFRTGVVPLDDGTTVPVGQITAGIGHAALTLGMNANRAAEHYDNTEAVVADVVTGNCRAGIWVAGATRPWAQAERVDALRASGEVSPDWRRVGGQLKLVALLTVNTSGYQVPRVRTLVAGGQIQAMIASGMTSIHMGPSEAQIEQQALRLEMDRIRKAYEAKNR